MALLGNMRNKGSGLRPAVLVLPRALERAGYRQTHFATESSILAVLCTRVSVSCSRWFSANPRSIPFSGAQLQVTQNRTQTAKKGNA